MLRRLYLQNAILLFALFLWNGCKPEATYFNGETVLAKLYSVPVTAVEGEIIELENFKVFYTQVCVDDLYIYALYADVLLNFGKDFPFRSKTVHVFDWEGRIVQIIEMDSAAREIAFDPVSKSLYNLTKEDVLKKYDPSFLYQ
ncbi:MAG: hypothetical protein LBR67_03270 [Dysgonamonadaceae bacterium]|jgi:hypothetical protein|nr:hypothetical protein [Dysgonamonadaceae bacterium]